MLWSPSPLHPWPQEIETVVANQKPRAADRALRITAALAHVRHGLRKREDWLPPKMIKAFHDGLGKVRFSE